MSLVFGLVMRTVLKNESEYQMVWRLNNCKLISILKIYEKAEWQEEKNIRRVDGMFDAWAHCVGSSMALEAPFKVLVIFHWYFWINTMARQLLSATSANEIDPRCIFSPIENKWIGLKVLSEDHMVLFYKMNMHYLAYQ